MIANQMLKTKYEMLLPVMDERLRRVWAASGTLAIGHGGIAEVSKATGLARNTIRQGQKDLQNVKKNLPDPRKIRALGGGRMKTLQMNPNLY